MIFLFLGICSIISLTDGTCTFPGTLDGLWTSSHNGDLTFNSTHVEYPVEATGGNLLFECYELTGTKYLLRSETFPLFSSFAVAVLCVELTELKTSLYQMNIYTSKLADANYQRVKYVTTSTTVTDSVACDNSANTEFHLLVKNGSLSDVAIQCPDILLGTFVYTFNETSCVNDTGSLNTCGTTSLDTLSFNYTACSTEQAYSADGNVQCIYTSTVGSAERVHVYNLDTTTDESTYYRFTCYMLEQSGDRVIGTQHPQDCLSTQTTTSVDSPGATINMTASVTCVPSTTTSTVATAAIVAGVLAALVVLTIAGLLIGYFCWRAKCKKEKVEPRKGLPPTSTGHEDMVSDVSVISIGQESGDNGSVFQQNDCINHRCADNAFLQNDGIMGQSRMVFAKQCQNVSNPSEVLNEGKGILQRNQTKTSMVAKLISFFSFKKPDSTCKLLIKSAEKNVEKQVKDSLKDVDSDVQTVKHDTSDDVTRHVCVGSNVKQQADKATLSVKKQLVIDINISMTSETIFSIESETCKTNINTCAQQSTANRKQAENRCINDTTHEIDTPSSTQKHKTDNHFPYSPSAEIQLCETNKVVKDCLQAHSYSSSKAPTQLTAKSLNHISDNDSIKADFYETESRKISVAPENTELEFTRLSNTFESIYSDKNNEASPSNYEQIKGVNSDINNLNLRVNKESESQTGPENDAVQRDNEEKNITDDKTFGMPCINDIDNTTNSILAEKSQDDKYVDLQISEKTDETYKSNTMTRSEKVTNNQSYFTSVSAKPFDKSPIIESSSMLPTTVLETQSSSSDNKGIGENQGHFTDNLFLSHQILQNQIRILGPSNQDSGKHSQEKSEIPESNAIKGNEYSQRALRLSENRSGIEQKTVSDHDDCSKVTYSNTGEINTDVPDLADKNTQTMIPVVKSGEHHTPLLNNEPEIQHLTVVQNRNNSLCLQENDKSCSDENKTYQNSRDESENIFSRTPMDISSNLNEKVIGIPDILSQELTSIPNQNPPNFHSFNTKYLTMQNASPKNDLGKKTEETEQSTTNSTECKPNKVDEHGSKIVASRSNEVIELKIDIPKQRQNETMSNEKSSTILELKSNIPSLKSSLQIDSKVLHKKPMISNKITANTDLVRPKPTPRLSKPQNIPTRMCQTRKSDDVSENIKTEKKEQAVREDPSDVPGINDQEERESQMISNSEYSDSLDSSSEDEEIRVEEFSLDDTDDDTWSLATFAMPTKLEMNREEEEIPWRNYKRKRYKKKLKNFTVRYEQPNKDPLQDINDREMKKTKELPFLKSKGNLPSLNDESISDSKVVQNTNESGNCNLSISKFDDKTDEISTTNQTLKSTSLKGDSSEPVKGNRDKSRMMAKEHLPTSDIIKTNVVKDYETKFPANKTKEHRSKDPNISSATKYNIKNSDHVTDENIENFAASTKESNENASIEHLQKSVTLPDIIMGEKTDISYSSLPGTGNQNKTKQLPKTTKISNLLAKSDSMSLPKVSDSVKYTLPTKESRTKLNQETKGTNKRPKEVSSKKDRKPVKKKSKKTKTSNCNKNTRSSKKGKPESEEKEEEIIINYDKFGEKEEKLRKQKPNKFRFDQLPTILKSKAKERNEGLKTVTAISNEVTKEEVKLPEVVNMIDNMIEDNDNANDQISYENHTYQENAQEKIPKAHNTSKPKKKSKPKRKKKKKSPKLKIEISSSNTDSDDIEIDPSVYFTNRAGGSSRPASSHELPQLINKIKLTASCTDIRSLCGDLD